MKTQQFKSLYRAVLFLLLCLSIAGTSPLFARVGGAGGHSSSGGSHSSSSHSSSSSSSSSHSSSSYSGGGGSIGFGNILTVIVIIIVILYILSKKGKQNNSAPAAMPMMPIADFPEGLDTTKVTTSFISIQNAWSAKDLKGVRKWLSDGMYQKLTTQFRMMKALDQKNTITNIEIQRIAAGKTITDGQYQTVDIAISFAMDDSFESGKYPEFDESFNGDTDTEFWTFIKRTDSEGEKNLYDNNNCPNCGALFEVKLGEISRCSNCNTLTNSAAYDWVLSEITQDEGYNGGAGLTGDTQLKELMKDDPFFAVQRMEDIASNVFMQIMDVYAGDGQKRLTRFADEGTRNSIMQQKQAMGNFLFDRLYLDGVTLTNYTVDNNVIKLSFSINANYRRVAIHGNDMQILDEDFISKPCKLELSRTKEVSGKTTTGETVYSYECSTCGAPYTDTTEDKCTYCDAPVVDKQRNWVLTGFSLG